MDHGAKMKDQLRSIPPCLSCPLLVVFGITSLNKGYHDLITLWAAETGYIHQGEQLFFTKSKCFW